MNPTPRRFLLAPVLVMVLSVLVMPAGAQLSLVITSTTAAAGSNVILTAMCPAGLAAVGGGVDAEMNTLISSAPYFAAGNLFSLADGTHAAPIGWRAEVRNNDTTSQTVKAAVLCAGVHPTTVVGSILNLPGQGGGLFVPCPAGMVAISGGSEPELDDMEVISMTPFWNGTSLFNMPLGQNSLPTAWSGNHTNSDLVNPRRIRAASLCVSAGWGEANIFSTYAIPAGEQTQGAFFCLYGGLQNATAGAIELDAGNSQELFTSSPKMTLFEGSRLLETPDGTQLPPPGWHFSLQNQNFLDADFKALVICTGIEFADGFETGDCSRWASSVGGC